MTPSIEQRAGTSGSRCPFRGLWAAAAAKDALRCRLAFIGVSEVPRLDEVPGSLAHSPMLTVGDVPPAAARAGPRVSSRLLHRAVPAEGEGRP